MGLREFNLTSIIPGVNAWASEKGRTILLDETTTNQNCSRLFPHGLKEVLHLSSRLLLSGRLSEPPQRRLIIEDGLIQSQPLRHQSRLRVRYFDDLRFARAITCD